MELFEVFDDSGRLQLSANTHTVTLADQYLVSANFNTKTALSCIAIMPPNNVSFTLHPSKAQNYNTNSFNLTGIAQSNPIKVFECRNTSKSLSEDTYGLALYDANGLQTYHSNEAPLKILGSFRSSAWGIPSNQVIEMSPYDNNPQRGLIANGSRFIDSISFPTGRNYTNTAIFISSIGAEGAAGQTYYIEQGMGQWGSTYAVYNAYYFLMRPYLRVENNVLKIGYSGTSTASYGNVGHSNRHAYDGGSGHVHGFFVDASSLL